ncbi:MAG TPA: Ig domain-containing protein [Acidimicrobiales bacterium]|nr:Ig domain-containing protein [Acidimicrobiales bacterium]
MRGRPGLGAVVRQRIGRGRRGQRHGRARALTTTVGVLAATLGGAWVLVPIPAGATGTWSSQNLASVSQSPTTTGLSGISCLSATSCVAVGSWEDPSGASHVLVNTLAGTTWSPTTGIDPGAATSATLIGISCQSATSCVAVGSYTDSAGVTGALVETLSGSTWSSTTGIDPGAATAADLVGVSCLSATSCVAVGSYDDASHDDHLLVETLSGTTWTPTTGIDPSGSSAPQLVDVRCLSATSCVAVGYDKDSGGVYHALVETLSGTTWTPTTGIDPSGSGGASLYGLSCLSASSCVAVGSYDDSSGNSHALVETLSGSSWTPTTGIDPGGSTAADLYGVSCLSATSCVAVGDETGSAGDLGLAEILSGSSWTATASLAPSGATAAVLSDVTCQSATSCDSVGYFDGPYNSSGVTLGSALVASLAGTTWTTTPGAGPLDAADMNLTGVACPSSSCVAVGNYTDADGVEHSLVETLSGTTSTATVGLDPAGATSATLQGISCSSTTSCVAVGTYSDASGDQLGYVVTLAGTTWTASGPIGLSGPGFEELLGISCLSSTACVAVGDVAGADGESALVETLSGTTWTATTAVGPSGDLAVLDSVSCLSSTSCVAVGSYTPAVDQPVHVLVSTLNGTVWTPTTGIDPGSGSNALLNGVWCTASTSCVAVGSYIVSDVVHALAENLSGSTWTPDTGIDPASGSSELNGIWCAGATSCVAGGTDFTGSGGQSEGLIEVLDGSSWTPTTGIDPTGAASTTFAGVACSGPTACEAAGSSSMSTGTYATVSSFSGGSISPLVITTSSLPNATAGDAYSVTLQGSGGATPYSWSLASGGLPAGLTLTSSGTISGTPSNAGASSFGVTLTDAAAQTTTSYFTLSVTAAGSSPPPPGTSPGTSTTHGYWLVASDGGIFTFHKPYHGSTGGTPLVAPVVGMASTADGKGYWLVAKDGGVFTFGDAGYHGSVPGLGQHVDDIVGMVADDSTGGYWIIGSDGSVWAFDAPQYGDLPIFGFDVDNIVGGAATPDSGGLYLVSATGHVYSLLGNGHLQGDASGYALNAPIVGMAVDPKTGGYWLVGQDGGIFTFGAPYLGSAGNLRLNRPVVGMAATSDGGGYWFVAGDGGIFTYGDAPYLGSMGAVHLNRPVVGMAGG